jgi:hypothetical protein
MKVIMEKRKEFIRVRELLSLAVLVLMQRVGINFILIL